MPIAYGQYVKGTFASVEDVRWFSRAEIALSMLVQGVWNNFLKLGMPVVAVGLLVAHGDAAGALAPAAVAGVALFVLALSGFAFGLGIDRMCGLMYELDDIRLLFENDVRFLEQFG